ncbi:30S ribosomal protein S21 [bacterium]|nr:30S ribosomal protein S21 [bacterium]MBU1599629.1 30S ribosomal protein S21 [bacterium]MBU2461325.1 30S ribosomal protein S21 [bacterium]
MAKIDIRENESVDNALRRFKRKCLEEGIPMEMKKRAFYDKPSVARKKKKIEAKKKKRWSLF